MSNKKITKEDQKLFRESVGIVKKVVSDRVILTPEKPKPLNSCNLNLNQTDTTLNLNPLTPTMGEKLFYARPSTHRKTVNALRKGKIEAEATLDLHGLTSKQAEQLLSKFMQQSLRDGIFSLLIVHGKGFGSAQKYPVLKNLVNNWLRNQSYVITFCSAGHRDGGTGAVRVLIDHE